MTRTGTKRAVRIEVGESFMVNLVEQEPGLLVMKNL